MMYAAANVQASKGGKRLSGITNAPRRHMPPRGRFGGNSTKLTPVILIVCAAPLQESDQSESRLVGRMSGRPFGGSPNARLLH